MSHNTWLHRLVRPAMRPLAATPVTPNHVTTVRLGTGLGAAAAFAMGSDVWLAWGGGLFLVSMLLDRADGELARLGGKGSPWGHAYDLWADATCSVMAFIGLGVGLASGALGPWAILLGAAAGAGIAVLFWLLVVIEKRQGERAAIQGDFLGFDADDALLVVPLAIWLGGAEGLLIAAGAVAPAFALVLFLIYRRVIVRSE